MYYRAQLFSKMPLCSCTIPTQVASIRRLLWLFKSQSMSVGPQVPRSLRSQNSMWAGHTLVNDRNITTRWHPGTSNGCIRTQSHWESHTWHCSSSCNFCVLSTTKQSADLPLFSLFIIILAKTTRRRVSTFCFLTVSIFFICAKDSHYYELQTHSMTQPHKRGTRKRHSTKITKSCILSQLKKCICILNTK